MTITKTIREIMTIIMASITTIVIAIVTNTSLKVLLPSCVHDAADDHGNSAWQGCEKPPALVKSHLEHRVAFYMTNPNPKP